MYGQRENALGPRRVPAEPGLPPGGDLEIRTSRQQMLGRCPGLVRTSALVPDDHDIDKAEARAASVVELVGAYHLDVSSPEATGVAEMAEIVPGGLEVRVIARSPRPMAASGRPAVARAWPVTAMGARGLDGRSRSLHRPMRASAS